VSLIEQPHRGSVAGAGAPDKTGVVYLFTQGAPSCLGGTIRSSASSPTAPARRAQDAA
jgi:hypothetical protein